MNIPEGFVPCGCCGGAALRTRPSQERGTCATCIDAGCTGIPGSDGDQLRGANCPLLLQTRERLVRAANIRPPEPTAPEFEFLRAEQICAAAYAAQGGPAKDPEERFKQQNARANRQASAFEELYCQIRDIADDWHREAIARRDGKELGICDTECCDADKAIEVAMRIAFQRLRDMDY
jgi:hypothetical protein